jgi:hypothetical protein
MLWYFFLQHLMHSHGCSRTTFETEDNILAKLKKTHSIREARSIPEEREVPWNNFHPFLAAKAAASLADSSIRY